MSVEDPAEAFVAAIERNIAATDALFEQGEAAQVIGAVSGSRAAQVFWQRHLDRVRSTFGARLGLSLHEDLPVNQGLGLLLMWQRLRPHLRPGEGALMAFVFGDGTRATPLTEAECGQKPAIASFCSVPEGGRRRWLSIVEVALRYYAPVEAYLRRSGFDGVVVKWGDEIQIPTLDLRRENESLAGADVVRFVSMRRMTAEDAANKDWVGVDPQGRVTSFIPRRPLAAMQPLADRGLLQRRGVGLWGGVNLGSIAMSRVLLDALLEEFGDEINDPDADRKKRPDLDPQLFTALSIAAIEDPPARDEAWALARRESEAVRQLEVDLPGAVARLRGVLDRFEDRHGRPIKMMALDFGDQYWGDIGQHRQMYELYMALRDPGPAGRIARALAGLGEGLDAQGNVIAGNSRLGSGVKVRGSVLIDAVIDSGEVVDSVLIGTRCGLLRAQDAFDIRSTVSAMELGPRAGAYKVIADTAVTAAASERITTVFLPDRALLMRVREGTDLRDKATSYDVPILGNPMAFGHAHAVVTDADPAQLEAARQAARERVRALIDRA